MCILRYSDSVHTQKNDSSVSTPSFLNCLNNSMIFASRRTIAIQPSVLNERTSHVHRNFVNRNIFQLAKVQYEFTHHLEYEIQFY